MAERRPLVNVAGDLKELPAGDTLPILYPKSITVIAPTAAENITLFFTDREITVAQVNDAVLGTSPSVTWNIRWDSTRDDASPTSLFSSNRTTTSTSGASTTTFANATIPANSWVWIITSATSGTVNDFHVSIKYS